jgi:hypothetical protein
MNFKSLNFRKIVFMILIGITVFSLVGCNTGGDGEEGDYYTVVYDGNGGFLGNKTYTYRKLQVEENSKIPKYLSEYTQDPYVVSSLGLATRQGYRLLGWYQDDAAVYSLNVEGRYVYLDTEAGNGAYLIDEDGEYVYGYVIDPEGTLVFIKVQPLTDDYDPETTEYIFYEGDNGYGFYIYDETNAEHVQAYADSGSYTPADLSSYGTTALVFEDLTDEEKVLFANLNRYKQAFYPYTEADEGLDRYSYVSAYVSLESIFASDPDGNFVLQGTEYVLYDETNPDHNELNHYTIDSKYQFTPDATYLTPSDLERYSAEFDYWDFENDRVTEDIVLYAHWERKLTVEYVQTLTGQTTFITTKQSDDNTTQLNLVAGETIGKIGTIPLYAGYTFVGWSTSQTEFIPWDFENDVFPEGVTTLRLYSYMIEGTYTRVSTAEHLFSIATNPTANYVLVADIDLNGKVFNNFSPTGFEVKANVGATIKSFSGEFLAFDFTVSNYTINVLNFQKFLNSNAGVKVVMGFFPYVQNATISDLNLEDVVIQLDTAPRGADVLCEIGGAGLIGTALAGTTTVTDVDVDVVFTVTSDNTSDKPVYIGDIVAIGVDNVTMTNVTATIDYSAITGITTSTLSVQTLN